MKGKNILCTILLLILLPFLFAQNYESSFGPSHPMGKNHQGPMQRLPAGDYFALIGVRVEERENEMILSLFFNDRLNTTSLNRNSILINGQKLAPGTEILFNKNRRMARFSIEKKREAFTLTLTGLKSDSGKMIKDTEVENLEGNTFFKFGRGEHSWQKSSL